MFDAKMTRRTFATTMGVGALAALAGCGGGGGAEEGGAADDSVKIEMVTDTGGVNDQSFNQLAWAGMQQLEADNGWEVSYIESKQDADYATNLDKAYDDGADLIWGIGFAMAEAVNNAAEQNDDVQFALIDGTNDNGAENLTGVLFKAQEPSFAVGYIAARVSKSGKVGFVGGMSSETIQQFEYGFYAGIEYANKEQGTKVTYQGQYAESFGDAAKGKSIAQKMIKDGCDVLYHAAGAHGRGHARGLQRRQASGASASTRTRLSCSPTTRPSSPPPSRRSTRLSSTSPTASSTAPSPAATTSSWAPLRTPSASPRPTTCSTPSTPTSTTRPSPSSRRSRAATSSFPTPRLPSTSSWLVSKPHKRIRIAGGAPPRAPPPFSR